MERSAAAGSPYAAPTIAPGRDDLHWQRTAGTFYAFNPDGTQKWAFTTPVSGEPIYTAAAIDAAGNLYFGTLSGNFYSLTAAGTLRWTYSGRRRRHLGARARQRRRVFRRL